MSNSPGSGTEPEEVQVCQTLNLNLQKGSGSPSRSTSNWVLEVWPVQQVADEENTKPSYMLPLSDIINTKVNYQASTSVVFESVVPLPVSILVKHCTVLDMTHVYYSVVSH